MKRTPRTHLAKPWVFGISLSLLAAAIIVTGMVYVLNQETELVELLAIDQADRYTTALKEFRTLYTSEVVERVRPGGVEVSHDYQTKPGAIPLPVTLTMALGPRLGGNSGGGARLFSKYPFPWRRQTGGPQDDFEKAAVQALEATPNTPYFTFESDAEPPRLRYAIADRMRESCVNCHNSHPDSPKRDWKAGDVRGVLAVSLSLGDAASKARAGLHGLITVTLGVCAFGIISLILLVIRFRSTAQNAKAFADTTRSMNVNLAEEMARREKAEAEQLEMQAQMQYAQKLESLGLLAGGISHDFNNFLQGILGHTELASVKLEPHHRARENLEQVKDLVGQAAGLTEQLLAYAGKAHPSRDLVNLSELAAAMRPLISTLAGGTLSICYDFFEALPPVEGARGQLQQVLLNLLTNAADAIEGTDGSIVLRTGIAKPPQAEMAVAPGQDRATSPPSAWVFVEVEDTGCGMSQETLSKAFDPFFTTKSYGRGLGLAALQGIIRGHGGQFEVHTEVGRGTCFRVILPAVCAVLLVEPIVAAPTRSYDGLTILLVDDYVFVRRATADVLGTMGCRVLEAANGREAQALYSDNQADISVVILDIFLPDLRGFRVLELLRAINDEIPIILVSAQADPRTVQKSLIPGKVEFLAKPYSPEELLACLNRIHLPH